MSCTTSAMRGTTSACAENTRLPPSWGDGQRNYLRVRGEYDGQKDRKDTIMELPPRARRIPTIIIYDRVWRGTTSACAENTARWTQTTHNARNYLRVRGEYRGSVGGLQLSWELPPRARRIQRFPESGRNHHGTTSACAENTPRGRSQACSYRNYLRVRGEYIVNRVDHELNRELPPRARRIPSNPSFTNSSLGTTSACAENTLNELGLL